MKRYRQRKRQRDRERDREKELKTYSEKLREKQKPLTQELPVTKLGIEYISLLESSNKSEMKVGVLSLN